VDQPARGPATAEGAGFFHDLQEGGPKLKIVFILERSGGGEAGEAAAACRHRCRPRKIWGRWRGRAGGWNSMTGNSRKNSGSTIAKAGTGSSWHHHVNLVSMAFGSLRCESARAKKNFWCDAAGADPAGGPLPVMPDPL